MVKNNRTIWTSPRDCLLQQQPDHPVAFFCPEALARTTARFRRGFPGELTYAVKANPDEAVIANLAATGVRAFDVASPWEMERVRVVVPGAVLHYNNPVRSTGEIGHAVGCQVASYSVDCLNELGKLKVQVPPGDVEIAVRFKLPVTGAAYDFGAKFGAVPDAAVDLLARVAALGYRPALSFHPGTQCHDASVWVAYIREAAEIARRSGVKVVRLNVGGGFPSHRLSRQKPDLETIFAAISATVPAAFRNSVPALLCEPGRGLVGDAFALATRVKAIRPDGAVFLNDGIYGGLSEHPVIGPIDRLDIFAPDGRLREGKPVKRPVFGPTCDSVDKLPEDLCLPADLAEGDFLVFHGLGAYSTSLATRFNGYGVNTIETVARLDL